MSVELSSGAWGVAANVLSDKILRIGAKVTIVRCDGDDENPEVFGRNKYGKNIRKYTKYKRLVNYRPVWLTPEARANITFSWDTKEEAAACAKMLNERWGEIRVFSPDGKTLVKDGRPNSHVFKNKEEPNNA